MSRRRPVRSLFGDESTRRMIALAASLLVVTIVVRLPLYERDDDRRVNWLIDTEGEGIRLKDFAYEALARPTRHVPPAPAVVEDKSADGQDERTAELVLQEQEAPPPQVQPEFLRTTVHDFAHVAPQIVGGLRAFYIDIDYPAAAREAGVQGRLILDFIVEPDGSATEIRVIRSLHPLCDSAAVDALSRTRFVPGVRDGEEVRVRMRLPVRFRLLEQQADASS